MGFKNFITTFFAVAAALFIYSSVVNGNINSPKVSNGGDVKIDTPVMIEVKDFSEFEKIPMGVISYDSSSVPMFYKEYAPGYTYYRSILDTPSQKLYDEMYQFILSKVNDDYSVVDDYSIIGRMNVDEYNMSFDEVYNVYSFLKYDHPELYHLSSMIGYCYSGSNQCPYVDITGEIEMHLESADVRKSYNDILAQVGNDVKSTTTGTADEYESYERIIEYLSKNTLPGDTSNYMNYHHSVLTLVKREGVCEGYADSFQFLANNVVKLRSIYCMGQIPEGYHAWNEVEIEGDFYLIDACWTDGGESNNYQYFLLGSDSVNGSRYSDDLPAPSINNSDYVHKIADDSNSKGNKDIIWGDTSNTSTGSQDNSYTQQNDGNTTNLVIENNNSVVVDNKTNGDTSFGGVDTSTSNKVTDFEIFPIDSTKNPVNDKNQSKEDVSTSSTQENQTDTKETVSNSEITTSPSEPIDENKKDDTTESTIEQSTKVIKVTIHDAILDESFGKSKIHSVQTVGNETVVIAEPNTPLYLYAKTPVDFYQWTASNNSVSFKDDKHFCTTLNLGTNDVDISPTFKKAEEPSKESDENTGNESPKDTQEEVEIIVNPEQVAYDIFYQVIDNAVKNTIGDYKSYTIASYCNMHDAGIVDVPSCIPNEISTGAFVGRVYYDYLNANPQYRGVLSDLCWEYMEPDGVTCRAFALFYQ